MKTSARFLAMLLAVLMIAGAAMTVSAFSDVEEGYEHATAIATLSQLGVIGGYEDGTFKPNANVERDEMAKLVYVLYTTFSDAGSGAVKFSDVPAGHWATGFVSWCSAKSIVGGFGDGTFKPDENVTYDQALKMVCATLGYTDFDSALWPTDVRQKAITDLKLNKGLEKVNGSDNLTRGQVAQLLYNALDVDMAETKTEYVYSTQYVDDNGDEVKVKVPVEVAKTLMEDVWKFAEEQVRVVATENLVFNAIAGAAKTNDGEKIMAATYTVASGVTAYGTPASYDLAELGLESYKDNTDALIGLDIMTVEKDGELLAKANVLGSVKLADVTIGGRDSDGEPEADEVKIDGVLYADARNSDTLFANLKTLTYSTGAVATGSAFSFTVADGVADLEYPHAALVMDSEGDGIADAIAIGYYAPYVVTATREVKATADVAAHTLYTVNPDLTATAGGTPVKSLDIADGKTLAKGDIFVAANINGTWYVDAVVEATADAEATKVTSGKGAAVNLKDIGAVKLDKVFKDVAAVEVDAETLLTYVDGKPYLADYYIYNGSLIYTTAEDAVADSYKLALLYYVDKAGEQTVVGTSIIQEFPAVLLINGKLETVKLNPTEAIIDSTGTLTALQASADGSAYRIAGTSTIDYPYTLVSYTVDNDGLYTLTNLEDTNITATKYVASGATFTINTNTGLISIGSDKVVLDDNSVIYYEFDKDGDGVETFMDLGTYNKSNILAKFNATTTTQQSYLLDNEDGTYTLLATFIADEGLVEPDATVTKTYKNDARLIKYSVAASAAESQNGVAYYSYAWLDMAAMTNGALVINTTLPAGEGADKATKAAAGKFYGWDATTKKYVEVTDAAVDADTIQIGTISNVNENLGIVDLAGTDWAEGIKLGADVKIFGAANKTYSNQYVTFDVAGLAELLKAVEYYNDNENDGEDVVINCAVGTYVDDNDETQIAWIIVDNWYYVTNSDNTQTYTKAYDIVGAID